MLDDSMNVLFVTWDGPQVTYLESLFIPIFKQLLTKGFTFHVLQFTWGDSERLAFARQACEQAGISYKSVTVWRRPKAIGALFTALAGARHIKTATQAHNIDLVMPRSILPALAAMRALRNSQCQMVFDADGLPLDERVDFSGQSPSGLAHRFLRDVEAQAVRRADRVLTRTNKALEILHNRAGAGTDASKFHVVTNGRDAERFRPADVTEGAKVRRDLGLALDTPLLVYAGSMGSQYCLEEMLTLFAKIRERRSDSHFLILTGSPEAVQPALDKLPQLSRCVTTLTVQAQAVPQYLGCADLGLALRQPSFSMQAVAPIKLGEYLLCGLPVVATAGIGATGAISTQVGMLLQRMDESDLKAAADWFIDSVLPQRERYRASSRLAGLNRFSLEASTASYEQALQGFGSKP